MTTADRRLEIVSILVVNGHVTSRELAQEFGVARRTILNDVAALTYGYPIYTKQGAEGEDKEILKRVLKKYGAYKLEL